MTRAKDDDTYAPLSVPRDPDEREQLYNMAGLSDEERAAIERWCWDEEMKRARGVLLYEAEPPDSVL